MKLIITSPAVARPVKFGDKEYYTARS